MTVPIFFQLIVNGLSVGMIYVLIASGLILILGIARIFNFAHGNFYMLGAYATYGAYHFLKLPFAVSVIIAALVVGVVGGICYRTIFHRVQGQMLLGAMASIGLMMFIEQSILLTYGTKEQGMGGIFPGMISMGNIRLPEAKLIAILLCLLIMVCLYFLIMRTKIGKAMRAVTQNSEAALLLGIKTNQIYLTSMVLGSVLAGLAGAIVTPVFSIYAGMGHGALLLVFMVLIIGGMDSIPGAVLGGLLIGLLSSFGFFYFGSFVNVVIFSIVAVFLIFRPGGLLGHVVHGME